jgi:DNA-binding response OmpR family regulator
MPVMSGHELLAEVQVNHPEFSNIPFILLTALSDRENTLEGLKAGAEDYLTKPIDLDLLLAKISGCIVRLENNRIAQRGF